MAPVSYCMKRHSSAAVRAAALGQMLEHRELHAAQAKARQLARPAPTSSEARARPMR